MVGFWMVKLEGWLKGLIACTCVVVIASGAHYAVGAGAEANDLLATPQVIEKCQREIAQFLTSRDDLKEVGMRYYAIRIADCQAYGLVAPSTMNAINALGLAPYLNAYKDNPNVWRRS